MIQSLAIILYFSVGVLMAGSSQISRLNSKMSYPYIASAERTAHILKNWRNIKVKMTANEVVKILGEPDEKGPFYEPKIKNAKVIGEIYLFLIQRLKATGSQIEKNEKLVRISFDLDNLVTAIDHWGLEQ